MEKSRYLSAIVLYTAGFLDYARNDSKNLASGLFVFLSFRPSVSAWRNLVIRSTVLFITGFLDYARNDSKNRGIPKRFLFAKRF